jgi:hypothetical protein
MSTQKLSKRELIKQIATGVEDPELREQLIDALLEREESRYPSWDTKSHMAVHPDAVPSNVRLNKWLNALGGLLTSSIMATVLLSTKESIPTWLILVTVLAIGPFLVKHIYLSNIANWQRRERKPTRKFWGAMLQPSQKDSS